ncbi:MAG TPA: hypothetical protein VK030_00605, partial [Actinomycetales bacterium]|nr:hypothetical protein [Actinomycetales bacterium]
ALYPKQVRVFNYHERRYVAPIEEVAALVATLASRTDRLWPHEHWPRMRLDNGLSVGSSAGHGPVSYCIERIEVQTSADAETTNNEAAAIRKLAFRFTKPNGFDGIHSFAVLPRGRTTVLIHDLRMQPRGWARLTWPIFFRPLHDSLIEEAFDKATRELDLPLITPHRRSTWVRILHWIARAA